MLKRTLRAIPFVLAVPAAQAYAALTAEILPPSLPTDVSANGSMIVGNMPDNYETFFWTASSGIVRLGRSTVDHLGRGAGTPGVSDDGTRISATILSDDRTYATQGVWTSGAGWQECKPLPPDGGLLDQEDGSAWGISGDGSTVVGLYWRPGQTGGSAHCSSWTEAGGMVDYGSSGGSSRANATNRDGSVTVGWNEGPTGAWQPTVWRDGVLTTLNPTEAFCEATGVTPDGSVVVGSTWHAATLTVIAAMWRWDGASWMERPLGVLKGTTLGSGQAIANDVSADGRIVVGYNAERFLGGEQTGFIWTPATGMVDVVKLLRFFGYDFSDSLDVQSLVAISDDGGTIVGFGYDQTFVGRTLLVRTGNLHAALAAYTASLAGEGRKTVRPIPAVHASDPLVDLAIYDSTGKQVDTVSQVARSSAGYALSWNGVTRTGTLVPRGVYFARPVTGTGPKQRVVITR